MKRNVSQQFLAPLKNLFQLFNRKNSVKSFSPYQLLPAHTIKQNTPMEVAIYYPSLPAKRSGENTVIAYPYFNILLKQVAARLSVIEMAIECRDGSIIRNSAHVLDGLFLDMKIPAARQLTGQMEEMAQKNKLWEVRVLLLAIKKMIGQVVQYNNNQKY